MNCVKQYKFPRYYKIRKRKEYHNVYSSGKKFETDNFLIFIKKNNLNYQRIGITVTRKFGKAYKRNRMKRLLREFFRLNRELFKKGYDFVIVVKNNSEIKKLQQVKNELTHFFNNETIYNY